MYCDVTVPPTLGDMAVTDAVARFFAPLAYMMPRITPHSHALMIFA